MRTCCTWYRFLMLIVGALLATEYLFGTSVEYRRRWGEHVSSSNSSMNPRSQETQSEAFRSPLIKRPAEHYTADEETYNITPTGTPLSTPATATAYTNGNVPVTIMPVLAASSEQPIAASALPLCPETPPNLGDAVDVVKAHPFSISEMERRYAWLELGGHGKPAECRAPKRVALVVPFRCRAEHLLLFLQHMHAFLRRQQIDYGIYVVEQAGGGPFNRAALMNVGFVEASKRAAYDCFIFHDVDLLPEDARNLYTCPEMPRHMSVAVDVFDYALPYKDIFGGVSAISTTHFRLLNGFSNSFWGWGGEDDDMSNRIRYHRLHIARYPKTIAKYTMLTHKKEKANPDRYEALKNGKMKYDTDGLANLQYTLQASKRNKLYTWLLVHIGPPQR